MNCLISLTEEGIKVSEKEAAAFEAQGRDCVSCEVLITRAQELASPFQTCFHSSLSSIVPISKKGCANMMNDL